MLVPKMAKNGFNSVFRVWVNPCSLNSEWKLGTGATNERGIKTIFDHFRNSHARYSQDEKNQHKEADLAIRWCAFELRLLGE